jgi:hypothetical protein
MVQGGFRPQLDPREQQVRSKPGGATHKSGKSVHFLKIRQKRDTFFAFDYIY